MTDQSQWRHVAALLVRESIPWVFIVGPFLYLYSGHSAGGPQALAPHLKIVGLIWLALSCVRLAVWRWLPGVVWPRLFAAMLLGGVLFVLASYYLIVIAGLWSWGRVVSWELLSNYLTQLPGLASSLGMSIHLASAAAIVGFVGVLVLVDRLLTRRDWVRAIAVRLSSTMGLAVALGGIALAAIESAALISVPPLALREPITVTFSEVPDEGRHLNSRIVMAPAQAELAQRERQRYKPDVQASRPNLVMIVADALRADRLTVYGYERQTSPYLLELRRNGRLSLATRTVAACPESFCGLLAIARSKPLHHMADDDLSLHDVLRLHGYRIEFMLGGDHTSFYGLRKAYGRADGYFDGSMVRGRNFNDDELVLERARAMHDWDGQPVMLQVHLMSAHLLGLRDPKFARFVPAKPYVPWRRGAATDLSKPNVETSNHYDNGVLQLDDVLRRLLKTLSEKQYLRDAIVVLTGDHGEALGERGEYGHAKSVIEPAMQIPLVFAGFGRLPPVLAESGASRSSQIDIGPTLLRETGMPIPRTWAGSPLQDPLPRRQLAFQQGFYVGLYDGSQPHRTLKYWRHLHTGEERIFDVSSDPDETNDLLSSFELAHLEIFRTAAMAIASSIPK